ncbi:MAG: CDP-diacylglycerol-serine O-phosphatidyltransferase [Chaenotheca gracillima]|nr:MAG: CDP-diacylglycerol-serine O-phosphatidyltransferase [Chaenotheca gracillima]
MAEQSSLDKAGELAGQLVDRTKRAAQGGKAKPKKEKDTSASRSLELEPRASYIQHRIQLFEELKAKYDKEVAEKPREHINISLGNDRVEVGTSWETTPAFVARQISKSLSERVVIALVDGELWDLERPLEKSCQLELLDFEHPEGKLPPLPPSSSPRKKVFWHSSAHVLGEAAELRFGCDLCIGPPVEDGFYYEMALPEGGIVQPSDWKPLETIAGKAIKEKQKFERLVLSKADLLTMFQDNKYKQHIIKDKIPDGTSTTVYRCGPLIDLCRGPHVPNTGRIKAFSIMKNSASYFLGDAANDSLQRIYGVSFPDKKLMEEHKKYLEEAAKRDHRKIGKDQELFFFDELSPGSCFFLPHGTRIYNTLQTFLRSQYWERGYDEVISPNMYNSKLWETSGHWAHYKDDMFTFEVEKDQWALKPMNCPGHCRIFGHRERSYRELPWRMADFGVLHRNEASGALTGLTRVRRFQQDDTHVFCTQDQITSEIEGLFDFLKEVYGCFGFPFKLKLSTRPEKFLGEIKTWDVAEQKLRDALDSFTARGGAKWELNEGDGAFYGPKIDITISDALRREHQCATIQLDFQLPQKFELEYRTAEGATKAIKPEGEPEAKKEGEPAPPGIKEPSPGCARPVMIHRAIIGSFERFIAILTEHFAGKWPFWLSPRQILVVPVMPVVNDYVIEVQKIFHKEGMYVDIDISGNTMQKKIREGQLLSYNFIFVVGAQERDSRTVNIRNRDDQSTQAKGELVPLADAIGKLITLRDERKLVNAM